MPSTAAQQLHAQGLLRPRAETARKLLEKCMLCPRQCQVNRLAGDPGLCGIAARAKVASFGPHFGEEQPLVGRQGSGTIFFAGCNLRCCFCQNYDISQGQDVDLAEEVDAQSLAAIILDLQRQGCHNINLVTPSHVVPHILEALPLAIEGGLVLPLVFNSSGYDNLATLRLLEGVVDIYMPDFKFWRPETATRYALAPDYPDVAKAALTAMYRQVGDLELDPAGLAVSGLLVRHLLMPGGLPETEEILRFLATQISKETYVNIMAQYHPCGEIAAFPELNQPISNHPYQQAVDFACSQGLHRMDQPDFARLLRRLGWQ